MPQISLSARSVSYPVNGIFRISRGARIKADAVMVSLTDGTHTGYGECVPYARYSETTDSVMRAITAMAKPIADGLDRTALQEAMPAGAARNALDCAFWDLEAKQTGMRVWDMLDLPKPQGITTAYTISFDEPDVMQQKAAENTNRPLLKVKLASADDLPRVTAVRNGAPNAEIIVDANEGWTKETYQNTIEGLQEFGVTAIEQPLPVADDDILETLAHPIPLIADESLHTRKDLRAISNRYDMINIKLDKTGGLTEALKLKAEAQNLGLGIMIGCMMGSSLAMAPAMILATDAKIVDLDGPLLLAQDHAHPIHFNGSIMHAPPRRLWG